MENITSTLNLIVDLAIAWKCHLILYDSLLFCLLLLLFYFKPFDSFYQCSIGLLLLDWLSKWML